MSFNRSGDMLTVGEIADYFRVSERTVYRWLSKGILPAVRVGNVTRINRDDLDAFIATNTNTMTKGQTAQEASE